MKTLTSILFITLFSIAATAQDTTYYKEIVGVVDTPAEVTYYEVLTHIADSTYTKETYNMYNMQTGLVTYYLSSKYDVEIHHGKIKEWYHTGHLFFECTYVDGNKDGEFNVYWSDESLERTEQYNNGELISATCFDYKGNKVECDDFEKAPQFPGGDEALYAFLANNMQYPQMARESGIMGSVYLTFIVEDNGEITNISVLRGIGGGCDEECIRVIELMPRWIPGYWGPRAIPVQFNLPMKFSLEYGAPRKKKKKKR
jgi:TonB family protein